MHPDDAKFYIQCEEILEMWKKVQNKMENEMGLKVHEAWKQEFNTLRVLMIAGDTAGVSDKFLQIAGLFNRLRKDPKVVEQTLEELLK